MNLSLNNGKFNVHDDYYTPESIWKSIEHLIPKDKIIWEATMLNSELSNSPKHLKDLGLNVVYDTEMDALVNQPPRWDMIVTNPPFSTNLKKKLLIRFVELNKPFIIVMNSMNLFSKYLRTIFAGKLKDLQIITPRRKFDYEKNTDGEVALLKGCAFYSVFVAYKMNLKPEELWLV